MTIAIEELAGQGLVSEELFTRLVNRISREHDMRREFAARIMDQALAYLGTCSAASEPLSPSEPVDIGWHTFILYTREYAEFCERVAGRFIHHEPADTGAIPITRTPEDSMSVTVKALRDAGYAVDLELWTASVKCNQCREGCTHSGGDTGCHQYQVSAGTVPA
ncbi:glycine-rich domain-containing protein [Amycolatopsis sp. NPDC059090]|uniref:glycine-rich domain-containing protein n=1 Tax=unclassified Amycolatopsis TaxID=2618356 RepID=UPI0036714DE8